ncbi:protein BIG GRAIN 1-like E [Punica granatum]|nr:protein BIG GRAIN 1-like E [Punica granatum]OWM89456.1 hypothetical protein CDL15_Pgr024204 [Punica granatum]
MSVTGYSKPDRGYRRDDSGELDVFEAARYFSGYNDIIPCDYNPANLSHKIARDGDISRTHSNGENHFRTNVRDLYAMQKAHGLEPNKEKIGKHGHRKQPSSPGGRLASFLNSLFSQSASKRKKKSTKSLTTQSLKDHDDYDADESGGWRRRRRSSISHFRSSSNMLMNTTTPDAKSLYSSSSSGFRTPPPLSRSHKDPRSLSDHKQINLRPAAFGQNERHVRGGGGRGSGFGTKYGETGLTETGTGMRESRNRKFSDDDEDNDSDSSSDLFELQIYDLGYCSSGLPVYETTRIESIKRGPTMSNVAAYPS